MRNPPFETQPASQAALIAQAKQQARSLRRQAVPEFWANVGSVCTDLTRALTRFTQRLQRHRQMREQTQARPLSAKGG